MDRVPLRSAPDWMQRWLLLAFPLVIFFGTMAYAVCCSLGVLSWDLMFFSGLICIVLSLLAFRNLIQLIPLTYGDLWSQAIIDHANSTHERWRAFIREFEGKLNHWHQGLMGLFFVLVTVGIFIVWTGGPEAFVTLMINSVRYSEQYWWLTLEEIEVFRVFAVSMILLGSVIGLMAWRMVCLGIYVWRLGRRFNLAVQLGHPDTCGGLKPLGTLCFRNALIVTIPAIFLGFWIMFPVISGVSYKYWIPIFKLLLLIPLGFAIVSFLVPLWSIHQEMVDRRNETLVQQDQLRQNIDRLTQEVLKNSIDDFGTLTSSEYQTKLDQIKFMQDSYKQLQNSPIWPFDRDLVRRFIASQTIPILTTLGILSEKTPPFIQSLFEFFK